MRKIDTHFKGKNVVITGGSSGIGKATAKLLAGHGANVFIVARDQEKLDRALQEIEAEGDTEGQRYGAFSADVTSYEQVEDAIAAIVDTGGTPDILINCAGIVRPGYFEELPLSTFRKQMDVNFFGTLHTVKAVLPYMTARSSGHIVNVSSMGGVVGGFGYTAYGASKFAVYGFTEALRAELKPHNIGVSLVLPFDTETPQLEGEKKIQPLEMKILTGSVKPEKLSRPSEFIAYWVVVKLFFSGGEPMRAEQVAKAILRGIQKGHYLVLPDLLLKVATYLRGLIIPFGNWAQDQLIPVARKQRGADTFVEHDPVVCAPESPSWGEGPDDLQGGESTP
ncbi:MAG: SDR family oxidoreductase [Chloroflexota bacterium]|nr:SDR family oxidoreductase [Chloroflexota bacterium]